jgi:hypothetical protein
MSDNPNDLLRQSNEVVVPAVLELGDPDAAFRLTMVMSEAVRIPIRVERRAADAGPAGPGTATPSPGAQDPDAAPRQTNAQTQTAGLPPGAFAPAAPLPGLVRRRTGRFPG